MSEEWEGAARERNCQTEQRVAPPEDTILRKGVNSPAPAASSISATAAMSRLAVRTMSADAIVAVDFCAPITNSSHLPIHTHTHTLCTASYSIFPAFNCSILL